MIAAPTGVSPIRSPASISTQVGLAPFAPFDPVYYGTSAIQINSVVGGSVVNAFVEETHINNAATFSLKNIHTRTSPTAENPVAFVTATGSARLIKSPISLSIPTGKTLGTVDKAPFRLWLVLMDDATGDVRLGVMQSRNATDNSVVGFPARGLLSSFNPVGNLSGVFYSDLDLTAVPFAVLGCAEYDEGLPTAGAWTVSPTRFVLFTLGNALPNDSIQTLSALYGANSFIQSSIPLDNTIPQFDEGAAFTGLTLPSVKQISAMSVATVEVSAFVHPTFGVGIGAIFLGSEFRGALLSGGGQGGPAGLPGAFPSGFNPISPDALAVSWTQNPNSRLDVRAVTFVGTTDERAFVFVCGGSLGVNGSQIGVPLYGGAFNSYIRFIEKMT